MLFDKYKQKDGGAIRFYDINSKRVRTLCTFLYVLCFIFVVVSLFPVIWVALAGFKELKEFLRTATIIPSSFNLSNYIDTWNELKFLRYFISSFISVIGSVFCAVIFNGLLGYGLGILKPKGYHVIQGLVMWSLLIPSTVSIVPLFVNINNVLKFFHVQDSALKFVPIWLAIGANAFYVVLFKQFFEGLPKELLEAARIDGCGMFGIFGKIVLPLSKSIVTVIVIFAINAAWSDFLLPYLVLGGSSWETIMVRLFAIRTSKNITDVEILRAVTFSIIPPIILFFFFQKKITDGMAVGAIKG